MSQDVHDYHHKLTLEERHVYENVLAYLTTSDILAMRNIGLAVMEKMSAPELQIYQARQFMKRPYTPGLINTVSKPSASIRARSTTVIGWCPPSIARSRWATSG